MVNIKLKQEDLDDLREAMGPFVKISERYGKKFLQHYGDFVSNLKERSNDFQNPLLRKMGEAAEKDFFMPKEQIEAFSGEIKPAIALLFDEEFSAKLFSENIPAYKKRIGRGFPLYAHIEEDGKEYDSTNTLSDDDFENLESVRDEKYLRPNRMCQVDAPEIRAKANDLRSKADSDKEFAEMVYDFIKNEKAFVFKPLSGALGTFKGMGGPCLDQMSLLIALSRAGGIPARYKMHSLTFPDETQEAIAGRDPIASEVMDALEVFQLVHSEGELKIDGDWISVDPTFSDATEVGLELPVTKFGEEARWKERKEGEIILEGLPFPLRGIMLPLFTLLRGPIDNINSVIKKRRRFGKKRLEEIDITRYNREKKESYRDVLPSMEEVKEFREG